MENNTLWICEAQVYQEMLENIKMISIDTLTIHLLF